MKRIICSLLLFPILLSCGGKKNQTVQPEPKYGDWEIRDFVDDFDEPTGEKFVFQCINGRFSNSATASSTLSVYVYIYDSNFANEKRYDGKIIFDEYADGVKDMTLYGDGSPRDLKNGSKLIDKENHRAFYRDPQYLSFYDRDNNKHYSWITVFKDFPGTYEATIKGKYNEEYRFTINTEKLTEALTDAGLIIN